MINLFENETTQPSKLRTKNLVEIINQSHETNKQIKFKATMLRSILFDYSDAYILLKGNIRAVRQRVNAGAITDDINDK